MPKLDLSVVIPLYNEEQNVEPLYEAVASALAPLGKSYEIICVDDGSTDQTLTKLEALAQKDKNLVVVSFRRNFGQTAALGAGLDQAEGEVIVTLDGDLQNDPRDIPKIVEGLKRYDLVNGWRSPRRDPFWTRRLPSQCANWIISRVTGVRLHDYGCTLKAFKKEIAKELRLTGEMHRFIPAIAAWHGASVGEVKVNHQERTRGRSKYGLSRVPKVILDLIAVKFLISFSRNPIRIFGSWGLVLVSLGGLILSYLAGIKILIGIPIGGRPLLLLGILLVLIGVQFVALGLMGEMQARLVHQNQGTPSYAIRKIVRR